jgi:uncharacterized protein YjaG (DUF416 family)
MPISSRAHKQEKLESIGGFESTLLSGYSANGSAKPAKLTKLVDSESLGQHSGTFFGEIPESLIGAEEKTQIRNFISNELSLCEAERSEFIADIVRWQTVYKAPPADGPKNFPIRNASNITIPVVKEVANTLISSIAQTARATKPTWILEALAGEWDPFIADIQRFLDIAAERDLELDKALISAIIEAVKYGTAVLQTSYEVEETTIFAYSLDGLKVAPRKVAVKDGVAVRSVPIENFWIRTFETDPQKSRWCAKMVEMNDADLRDRVNQGKFEADGVAELTGRAVPDNDELSSGFAATGTDVQEAREDVMHISPVSRSKYAIFEVWLKWFIKGHGYTDLLVYYNRDRNICLSYKFNPYWHGKRPFSRIVYFPIEHCFYGEGVCGQIEELQKEISTIHNQRIDNATMANLKMIIKKRMLQGLKPGDPLYTGKVIEVNDIHNDMREFTMSEVYPSTVNNENLSRVVVERVSGVSDAQSRAMPVTRTTATAQLALLQEQGKRVDMTIKSVRDAETEIGQLTVGLYFQFGTHGKALAWMGERGKVVEAIFKLPRRVIEIGLGIKAGAPTSQTNMEAKRQNSLALFNLLVQMYEKMLMLTGQLAQAGIIQPQTMGPVAHALVKSADKFMRDTLASFDTNDPEEILAGLKVLERVLPSAEDFGGLSDNSRREESSQILDKISGLEDLLRQANESPDGSPRVPAVLRNGRPVPAAERVLGGSRAGYEGEGIFAEGQ